MQVIVVGLVGCGNGETDKQCMGRARTVHEENIAKVCP